MPQTPKKFEDDVLLLSNYFHPEPTGSAPPISDLAVWLAQNGVSIRVLTARPSYPQNRVFSGFERGQKDRGDYQGVQVRRLKTYVPGRRGLVDRLMGELSCAVAMAMSGEERAAHVICVCPSIFTLAVAPLFRRKHGRILAIVHDIQSGLGSALSGGSISGAMAVLRAFERWAFNRCDVIVALSTGMADELRRIGVRQKIIVQPPHVDVSEFPARPEVATQHPILLYSGNLGRKQGLEQLIGLAAQLASRGSAARLIVRGEGSERGDLEALAAARGLTNIEFLDLAPRAELAEVMAQATIHLVPQRPDGANFAVPSKIFSIMAAGRAFIATAAADSPVGRLVSVSAAGLIVPPDDPVAFALAVEQLLSDDARRAELGAAGRRYVEEHVDRNVVCRAILSAVRGDAVVS
jgi:colanic acid biosynthesis glycosyl transferase WcaI